MPAGRPSDYTPELAKQAWDYVETYKSKYKDEIPSNVGLAVALNLATSTVYKWAQEDDKEFSDILMAIQAKQQQILLNSGLNGTFNSAITKLVLGKHGYHEKQETELTGKDGGPLEITEIKRVVVSPSRNPNS